MTTRKNKPVEIWDEPFQHWHVLGPILWALVAYMGAGVLDLLAVPALYVAAVGAGVSLLAPLVTIYKRFSFLLMAATTALLTWTSQTTPWQRDPALAATAGGIVFGMVYQALRTREDKAADANKQAENAARKSRYEELLRVVGVKGLKEARRTLFPAGKTIHLTLPVDGSVTLSKLQEKAEALDIAAARAGLTCTFDFERGDSPAEVKLHVFDEDVLAKTIPLPFNRGPKSISEPMQLGQYATGEVVEITFREVAALMVGLKGRGKSGLINTHLQYLTGCTDAVVWMLDGKGGETVLPWLEPFLDMVTDKPVINWPAVTDAEFDAVLLAADAVRRFRSANRRPGPNPSRPSVLVIVEEASVITGVARFGQSSRVQLAQDGVTLGRSSFLDWLFATQRATLDMLGSGSMKVNLDLRYGMGVSDVQEGRMIFPDGQMARALARIGDTEEYRGSFLMQAPGKRRVMAAKGYWTDPETIPSIATSNAQWCAELDRETADYVHETLTRAGVKGGYYGRWDRICETLGRSTPSHVSRATDTPDTSSQPETRPTDTVKQYDGSRGAQAVRDAVERSRSQRDADTFQQLMEGAGFSEGSEHADWDEASVPETAPPILRHVLKLMQALGADKLPSRVICKELPGEMTPKALSLLMGLCNVSPVENIEWNGAPRARGYTWDDVETSVKRGSWTEGAFGWKP
jgi:hypothetical protein